MSDTNIPENEKEAKSEAQHNPVSEAPQTRQEPVGRTEVHEESDIDVRNFIMMLWRRKTLIILIIVSFCVLGWLALNYIQPRYTAQASVKIESTREPRTSELKHLFNNLKLDSTIILSEVEVLRSRSLAQDVIKKFDLVNDPELNPRIKRENKKQSLNLQAIQQSVENSIKSFSNLNMEAEEEGISAPVSTPNMPVTDRLMGHIVTSFQKRMRVIPVSGSYVIRVEYTSADPEKAARITNAILKTYLERRLQENIEPPQKLNEWLEARLKSLSDQVRNAEEAVEKYRKEKNLYVGVRAEISAERISELNTQLILAKAKRAEALARMSQVKGEDVTASDKTSAAEVLNSRFINQLKIRELDVQRNLSELSERYGPKHPSIINAKNELREIRQKIEAEINNVLQGVQDNFEVANARVTALEGELNEIETIRSRENKDMIELRELMREAEANRLIYERFQETNKQSDEQEKLLEPEAQVISYAIVPTGASYPNKPLFLSLTAVVALFFAIGVCLLLEKLDNAFRSAAQLEGVTGKPCYALVPLVENVSQEEIADIVIAKPSSNLTEAVRTLRTVLKLRAGTKGNRPKVVAITSSFPGEGKSTISSWLARIAAKSGERVIIIDGDLRRPTQHKLMRGRGDKTLVEYLTGQGRLEDIIEKDSATGLHKIYARSVPNSALDLIDSARMRNLIESLKKVYDLIVIDTPACLAVSDAHVLVSMADQALYCVNWDHTAREIVTTGIKQFQDMGYDNIAFVLTNVDVEKHARYGYGDTPYYYARYKEYYQGA